MDQKQANGLQIDLQLDTRQKQSVKALQRHISIQSSASLATSTSADFIANLNEEEIRLLRQVVESSGSYKPIDFDPPVDAVDGKKIQRNRSEESYLSTDQRGGTYVNPGRFYVRVSEDDVKTLNRICMEIDRGKLEDSHLNYTNSNSNGHATQRQNESGPWGYTVVVTKQKMLTASAEQIVLSNPNATTSVPLTSRAVQNNYRVENGRRMKYKIAKKSFLRDLPPRERFRQAVFLVINNLKARPLRKDWDFSDLWKNRGKATWIGIILTVVGLGAFLADIGTDIKVATDHFKAGSLWWGSLTALLIFLPTLFANLVSFFWYKEDELRMGRKPKHGWRVVVITHVLLMGLVERYWRVLVKSFRIKKNLANRVVDRKLLIAMNLDMSMLQMILAFTEDAPQLVLQLYVLVSRHYVDPIQATTIQDLWTILSICFSFISYSRAVVNYISSLRDSKRSKGQLRWYGYLSMWLWRAFMIVSRILTLVFFATEFKLWFFLVLFLHFFIILAFLFRHEVYFFPGNKGKQHFIRALMSYIHVFCFFCLDGVRTIRWAAKYYVLTFSENLIFSVLWYTNKTRFLPLRIELAGLVVIHTFFLAGVFMMTVYYKFLHPRFSHARFTLAPPLQSEVVDKDTDENAEQVGREQFELWV